MGIAIQADEFHRLCTIAVDQLSNLENEVPNPLRLPLAT